MSGERLSGRLRKRVTVLGTLLQLCRSLGAACLRNAAHAVRYYPCLAVHAVLLSDIFSLEFITAAQQGPESSSANEKRWGEMKNPESIEQWDMGFKSFIAISKDFYS